MYFCTAFLPTLQVGPNNIGALEIILVKVVLISDVRKIKFYGRITQSYFQRGVEETPHG
jgi:hypothetical protein